MKKDNKKIRICIATALFCFAIPLTQAQINDVGKMIAGGSADAQLLFKNYLRPYANALGTDLNAGWYSTAKPHKLGGFDLTVSASAVFIPSSDKTFDLTQIGLSSSAHPSANIAPTAAGKKESGPQINYTTTVNGTTTTYASYRTPQGTGMSILPAPMAQVGIGLIKGTEIIGRYCPDVKVGDAGTFGLWGVGVKHSLKQWIPVIDRLPFFNLSFMGGYSQLKSNVDMSVKPGDVGATDQTGDPSYFDNQQMQLKVKSLTANVLVSADLPVICLYGGLGISNTQTDLKLNGNYPVPNKNGTVTKDDVKKDPISMTIKNKDGNVTKPRLNAGFRLKFGILAFHVDYTYANYSVVTTGVGISFR
ncbi:MAG: hypothetical protein Q8910_18770 [Bacteroidota bacterium]|nr:hypothetical protein [Bacteroidota bacterium]MDP4228397.1 hypothetical protein [Bacteroidota bacterium]